MAAHGKTTEAYWHHPTQTFRRTSMTQWRCRIRRDLREHCCSLFRWWHNYLLKLQTNKTIRNHFPHLKAQFEHCRELSRRGFLVAGVPLTHKISQTMTPIGDDHHDVLGFGTGLPSYYHPRLKGPNCRGFICKNKPWISDFLGFLLVSWSPMDFFSRSIPSKSLVQITIFQGETFGTWVVMAH
jgi:hypothetical protein